MQYDQAVSWIVLVASVFVAGLLLLLYGTSIAQSSGGGISPYTASLLLTLQVIDSVLMLASVPGEVYLFIKWLVAR